MCVRAGDIYALHHTQLCASFYISVYQDDLTASTPYHIHMYVCMYVRIVSVEVTKLSTNKQHPLSVCMYTCMYACMYVCTYILCPNYEDPSCETRFRIHMYVCIYVCMYLYILRHKHTQRTHF